MQNGSHQAHVKITSYQCRGDVMTSHLCWYDIVFRLCACWDSSSVMFYHFGPFFIIWGRVTTAGGTLQTISDTKYGFSHSKTWRNVAYGCISSGSSLLDDVPIIGHKSMSRLTWNGIKLWHFNALITVDKIHKSQQLSNDIIYNMKLFCL